MIPPTHPQNDRRLRTLADLNIMDTPRESDFDEIVDLAAALCDVPVAMVSLIDHERQWFKAKVGTALCETSLGQSICAHAILEQEFLEIPDTTKDPRTSENILVTGDEQIRFYAGATLRAPNDMPLGTLCVLDRVPRQLTALQRQGLLTLARQVMTQIRLRQLLQSQEILRQEMDHRVKNSLQSVQSLIRLYAGRVSSGPAKAALGAVERRLNAVVALHRQLNANSNAERVMLRPFMEAVIGSLAEQVPPDVTLTSAIADLEVSSTEATAMAVIANECVANSLKHAFRDGGSGKIHIACDLHGTEEVVLICSDDGVGALRSEDRSGETGDLTSLGQRIIAASAEQIGGSLTQDAQQTGHAVTVRFTPAPPLTAVLPQG